MNEIFDIVNCDENRESQKKLFQLIKKGESILFVGSGISKRLGYPSWEDLLIDLSNLLLDKKIKDLAIRKIKDKELLLAAEIIKNKIDITSYNTALEKIFGPKNPSHDDFHKLLINIKFKGFVTTNYDPIVETALKSRQNPNQNCSIVTCTEQKSKVHAFLNYIVKRVNYAERFHLFLHGRYNLPDTTILSYGDYIQKYNGLNIQDQKELYDKLISGIINTDSFEKQSDLKSRAFRTLHYKVIYLLIATQSLVFIGFGLRDEFLNKIINDIQEDFDPFKTNHFALLSKNGTESLNRFDFLEEQRKWRKKGVELVFFDDDSSFNGIEKFFKEITPECFVNSDSLLPETSYSELKNEHETHEIRSKIVEDKKVNIKLIKKAKLDAEEIKRI